VSTLDLVLQRAPEIRSIAAAHGARNVRVVGSVARGTDRADSDLDLLVTFDPGVGLLAHAKLVLALEQLLARKSTSLASEACGRRCAGIWKRTRRHCEAGVTRFEDLTQPRPDSQQEQQDGLARVIRLMDRKPKATPPAASGEDGGEGRPAGGEGPT